MPQIIAESAAVCFKTKFSNFKSGWISSENMFVAPTRKGEKLRKLADLLKTELFVVVEEGESFSSRVCSSCGTKVRNCAAMLSQIREKLNTPTDNDQLLRLKRMSKSPVRISVDRPNTTHKLAAM